MSAGQGPPSWIHSVVGGDLARKWAWLKAGKEGPGRQVLAPKLNVLNLIPGVRRVEGKYWLLAGFQFPHLNTRTCICEHTLSDYMKEVKGVPHC